MANLNLIQRIILILGAVGVLIVAQFPTQTLLPLHLNRMPAAPIDDVPMTVARVGFVVVTTILLTFAAKSNKS